MVRICDGRMSGTAYGTVVLHVAPEAAAGGLLALVAGRRRDRARRAGPRLHSTSPTTSSPRRDPGRDRSSRGTRRPVRGWERLYVDHVQQADTGADLDFLVGASGPEVARESH